MGGFMPPRPPSGPFGKTGGFIPPGPSMERKRLDNTGPVGQAVPQPQQPQMPQRQQMVDPADPIGPHHQRMMQGAMGGFQLPQGGFNPGLPPQTNPQQNIMQLLQGLGGGMQQPQRPMMGLGGGGFNPYGGGGRAF